MAEIPRVVLRLLVNNLKKKGEFLTKNLSGEDGAGRKFTAQSIKVWLPRIAKTTVFISSIGMLFRTIALVPCLQSASTWVSRSAPVGRVYTRSENCAARHKSGYVGMYLWNELAWLRFMISLPLTL